MAIPSPRRIARMTLPLRGAGAIVVVMSGAGCAVDRAEIAKAGHVPVIADYAAPADIADDPWAPYIAEAASRFDVPETWIREVMQRESGGRHRAVSRAGAIGLMQLMPGTWRELRGRYRLGSDPFLPRDNILAGTAYIREMYDRFGAPGFLAAYNAGPGAFARALAGRHRLPPETQRFVAAIAPRIEGIAPASGAVPTAHAALQGAIAGSPRPARPVLSADQTRPAPPPPAAETFAGGFRLVSAARAATLSVSLAAAPPAEAADPAPAVSPSGGWAIQVGAFRTLEPARSAIEQARAAAPDLLASARPATPNVETAHGRFVRARLTGLSPEAAVAACRRVVRQGQACFAVAPAARS
ncbi:lytic transglycosylase domain-containing protein [Elioraea sp. Yellowstone]|jgi:hypothetical protein|nr:lytic transglycosylase domain-containing protein [Elioraea sp. Yellowstone]